MVWTIATSGGTTTITPDGTSSADLKTLLDTAISGSQSGITNPGSGVVYQVTNNIQINGTAPPYFLYIGGIVLDCYQRFVLGNNARVNYSYLNTSGQSVGRTTLILRAQPTGYVIANGIYSISGSTYQQSDSLDLIATNDQSNPGAITYGYDVGSASNGSFDNCTFAAAKTGNRNHIFYFDTSIYANCQWDGWDACEVTSTTLLRSAIFRNVDVLKTYTTDAYLEKVSAASFRVLNSKSAYLTDCSISVYSAVEAFAPSGLYIYERNSFELLGTSTEASGLMVLRLPNNSLIFKRTLDSSGKASGNNPISATNGTSSSSDRLVIPITQITPPSTYLIDNRGAWEGVFVRYGRLPYDIAINLQGNTATSQSIPFSSAIDASITIGNAATVAAYTGIAIDHLNSLISITAAVTKQKLYDYLALEKASFADSGVTAGGNAVPKCCLPTLADFIYTRSTGIFAYNLSLSSPAADPTGVDGLALSAGKNITLNAAGDYSAYPIDVSTTSTLFVSIGNSSLLGWTLPLGTSITRIGATGSAIVTVDASQLANITAGAGVTIQSPQLTLQVATTIGASVSIRAASTNALIANGTADGTGAFTAAYSGSSLSAILRVRKAGYIPIQNTVAITSAGLTASAVLFADANYNPTY